MHESSMHDHSSYVTLTYDDSHLPDKGSLDYRHFQLFMKRLRARVGGVRFYMCGEYGEENWRPHFHACLFGVHFADQVFLARLKSGFNIYRSALLENLWPHGYSSVGEVTFESVAYVARYVMKKINGAKAEGHYERVSEETGEIYRLLPEFNRMSLRPGIGKTWLDKHFGDIYRHGFVVARGGQQSNPPRYYDKQYEKIDAFNLEYQQFLRWQRGSERFLDNTEERLAVREICTRARLAFKKRGLAK